MKTTARYLSITLTLLLLSFALTHCEDNKSSVSNTPNDNEGSDPGDTDGDADGDSDGDSDGDGDGDSDADGDTETEIGDPRTCEEAVDNRTYIGCDFWPTVNYNPVDKTFDFAVVAANAGEESAEITVTKNGSVVAEATAEPGGLATIELPWVDELKGPTFSNPNTAGARANASILVDDGAYHLTSTFPVTVWQFNPLQYESLDFQNSCIYILANDPGRCLSVSNDASLLLPSTAMTGAYSVFGRSSSFEGEPTDSSFASTTMAFTVTATQDDTQVDILLSGDIIAGPGVTAASAGEIIKFTLNAGDVVQLLGAYGSWYPEADNADLSGSIVNANHPVQVISLNPISNIPDSNTGNADHIEESILPSEVLGQSYVIAPPTGPDGRVVGHVIRLFGITDGTTLTYTGNAPTGAPTSLNAGEMVEINNSTDLFVVDGTEPFAAASFMLGGMIQDPGEDPTRGDPAFSMMVTPEQFRDTYTFLAPVDFMENYADIIVPAGTTVTIDGKPTEGQPQSIGAGWSIIREKLQNGNDGAHQLEANNPVGLQIMGYGHATAYYYPGGLNLTIISDPIIII